MKSEYLANFVCTVQARQNLPAMLCM